MRAAAPDSSGQARGRASRRSRLDHDEGAREGSRAAIRLRFRSRRRPPASSRRHASAGSPPSTVYRVSKFVRRHRIGVTTTVVIAALLVAFATTMAVQARRIGRERDRANREAQAAKEIADFLVGLFTVSDRSQARGNTVTAREILDQGAQRIGALSGQPSLQGRLQRTLGGVYTSLGLYALADRLLERALDTERRVLGSDNRETMDTLFAVGDLRYYEQRHAEAEAAYREAAQRRRVLLGPDAKDTMEAEMAVASACMQQGRFDEAERLLRSTLERQQRSTWRRRFPHSEHALNELSVLFFQAGAVRRRTALRRTNIAAARKVVWRERAPDAHQSRKSGGYSVASRGMTRPSNSIGW